MERLAPLENVWTQIFVAREHGMELMTSKLDGHLIPCQDPPPREVVFGRTDGMREVQQLAEKVAATSAPVLILGEKGTGKEVLARYIHCRYPGPEAPFFKVSPPISKGNSLDQVALRVEEDGLSSEGNGDFSHRPFQRLSTLFVEEIADLDLNLQFQLFQLIQGSRSFVLGGSKDIPIALRVICASSHNLEQEAALGRLREDLLSSLSIVKLFCPPLRERKEDIPQLAHYFRDTYNRKFGCQAPPPSPRLIENLEKHNWPGNIRELESAMKRYVVLETEEIFPAETNGEIERPHALEPSPHRPVSLKQITREAAHELEGKIILRTLQKTQWNRKQAARALNISYRALLYKIKEAGLPPKRRRKNPREAEKETPESSAPRLDAAC